MRVEETHELESRKLPGRGHPIGRETTIEMDERVTEAKAHSLLERGRQGAGHGDQAAVPRVAVAPNGRFMRRAWLCMCVWPREGSR